MAARRPVEVVDFSAGVPGDAPPPRRRPRPRARAAGAVGAAGAAAAARPPTTQAHKRAAKRAQLRGAGDASAELTGALEDVYRVGMDALTGRDRKAFERERLEKLGCRFKNQKMPLKMLVGMRAKAEQRRQKREDRQREAGVVVARSGAVVNRGRDRVAEERREKRKRKENVGILGELQGTFKGGVLRVGRETIRANTSRSRGSGSSGGGSSGGGGGKRRRQ